MNKLTKEALLSFKLTHPKGTQEEVARLYGVSQQRISELWNTHYPNKKFNNDWGLTGLRVCKTCGKRFRRYNSDIKRGGGIYCSLRCKYTPKNSLL